MQPSEVRPAPFRPPDALPTMWAMLGLVQRVLLVVAAIVTFGFVAPAGGHSLPVVPEGVTVGGVDVGGLIAVRARDRVESVYGAAVRFRSGKAEWRISPMRFGATAELDRAVEEALAAESGTAVSLDVTVKKNAVRAYVAQLDRRYAKAPTDAELVGLKPNLSPRIVAGAPGRRVNREALTKRIMAVLRSGERATKITLPLVAVAPTVTRDDIGPIIVIRRGSNRLTLWNGTTLVRNFTVATGSAQYPTPLGDYEIVIKERDPTWNPPDSDWAKDAKPIPPGPGNPLGTRWMGISAPAVGIHGTPDAASLGYSASHGCIRMAIPEAEWLFEQVEVGTPVFIVSA
jgi:lipoprotein-anchoring transpeptidase ErfK/SrfK